MLSLQFNRTTEYAMRAMAYLALQQPDQPIPVNELAKMTGIPRHYLSKVMKKLVESGMVRSQKGHGGGFALAKAKQEIHYHDILVASGYEAHPNRCVFGWGECNPDVPCPLHDSWVDLNNAFKDWAMKKTSIDVQDSGV